MNAAGASGRLSGTIARTLAQAKVNLVLRVLAREESGYHQLETVFCRLDLADDVIVRTNVRRRSLDCTGAVIPKEGLGPTERNLAWRAAAAYADATGWPNAWAIEIAKSIPVGGGLGGGSADAGGVLRCLNALAPAPLDERELLALAEPLGADVPFLSSSTALAVGRGHGERLLALRPLPERAALLVCFPFGVSTRDAYGWLDDARVGVANASPTIDLQQLTSWHGVARIAHNDFEAVVAPRHADIASALAVLRSYSASTNDAAAFTLLAGSGATVFMIADSLPNDMSALHGPLSRIVRTHTANRVVDVEVSG